MKSFFAFIIGISSLFASQAQTQPDENTLEYWKSKPFQDLVLMTGMLFDQQVLDRQVCASGAGYKPISFSIVDPLVFDGSPHPKAGKWTLRFAFTRCGESITYNTQYTATANGPVPGLLPPGESIVSKQLFGDLLNGAGAMGVAEGEPRDCRFIRVLDSKLTMPPSAMTVDGQAREGVWEEVWTTKMCSGKHKVTFCLVPRDGGVSWSAKACPRP